jgi:death on curing protein
VVETIQAAQLREHGGSPGLRDEGMLESALARPQQKFAYADQPDIALLAAAYAFGLAKNHAFVDGNKRTAFMAAYVFLGLNGHDLTAEEVDVVATMESVAAGRIDESALADWVRAHLD